MIGDFNKIIKVSKFKKIIKIIGKFDKVINYLLIF